MDKSFEKLINRVLDGRYRIESVVGIGGMAYVLRAADMQNGNRPVAIKVLNEEFNRDTNAVKRFVNESETIAMVDSPNIVKIHDVAISENLKYIVMEFIDGITLKDYIDKVGALGWKEAVHYVRQILTGLSHAHEKGIIHRDVKPQNVMLLRDGKVKVTDFGIAKNPTSESLTMTDKAIGTVNYISPEQASGEHVDEKSDVYSVGIMLYEMLTGKLPFTAESPVAVAMMQVNDNPVPPRAYNPQIPVGLEQIILKSMSKKPEERFNGAVSMEKALEYFVNNPETVFSGVATPDVKKSALADVKKDKGISKHRSMFPIVLGVSASFFVVIVLVAFSFMKDSQGFSFIDKFFGYDNREEYEVTVDDFTGMIYDDQTKEVIKSKGYLVVDIRETAREGYSKGEIVNHEPGPDDIVIAKDYVELVLYVNRGNDETDIKGVGMPDCIGTPLDSAVEMILENFSSDITADDIEIKEEFNEKYSAGVVCNTNPAPRMAFNVETDKIILYVSKGKEMKMPVVVDKDETVAVEALKKEGVNYRINYVDTDDEEKMGVVLDASVVAGMNILETETVVLTVGRMNYIRPEKKEPEEKEPEVKEPEVKEPEKKAPEKKEPEVKEPEKKEPEKKEPEVIEPEVMIKPEDKTETEVSKSEETNPDTSESSATEDVPSVEQEEVQQPSADIVEEPRIPDDTQQETTVETPSTPVEDSEAETTESPTEADGLGSLLISGGYTVSDEL